VIVSDNQSWVHATSGGATTTMREWDRIVRRSPAARLVCIDIQPHGTTQASGRPEILNVAGFSDAVFDTISRFANGQARDWVELVNETEV
jgi:60 kDa SS-A/Ro ribonucleoprotein